MSDVYNEIYDKIFIEEKLTFFCFDDLYRNKEKIREKYLSLPIEIKRIYKWYFFYQLCLLNYGLKSAMWEYINYEGNNLKHHEENIEIEIIKLEKKREKLRRTQKKD